MTRTSADDSNVQSNDDEFMDDVDDDDDDYSMNHDDDDDDYEDVSTSKTSKRKRGVSLTVTPTRTSKKKEISSHSASPLSATSSNKSKKQVLNMKQKTTIKNSKNNSSKSSNNRRIKSKSTNEKTHYSDDDVEKESKKNKYADNNIESAKGKNNTTSVTNAGITTSPKSTTKASTRKPRRSASATNAALSLSSIYQYDTYDIVIPSTTASETTTTIVPPPDEHPELQQQQQQQINEFYLLLQIDHHHPLSSKLDDDNDATNQKSKKNKATMKQQPNTIMNQTTNVNHLGNVIGRIEAIMASSTTNSGSTTCCPMIKLDYYNCHDLTSTANAVNGNNSNHFHLGGGGTTNREYIGQIMPGPTILVCHKEQMKQSSIVVDSNKNTSAENEEVGVTRTEEIDSKDTLPTSSREEIEEKHNTGTNTIQQQQQNCGILVVDQVLNEFCNMIPATSSDHNDDINNNIASTRKASPFSGNKSNSGSSSNIRTDYFQYSDYDVNR